MGFGTKVDRDIDAFQRRMRLQLRKNLQQVLTNQPIITERRARITLPHEVGSIPQPGTSPKFPLRRWLDRRDPITSRPGDEIGRIPSEQAGSGSQGGEDPGSHGLDVWVSEDDLYALIAEEWQLPRWEPRSDGEIPEEEWQWNRRGLVGPPSRWLRRQTLREMLRRGGLLDQDALRYRKASSIEVPETSAAVALIRDISGSMANPRVTAWIRAMAFVLSMWLRQRYPTIRLEFFTYDIDARQVTDEAEWFAIRPQFGGTRLASALDLVTETFTRQYPPAQWQWYQFLWTDGQDLEEKAVMAWLSDHVSEWNELGWVAISEGGSESLLETGIFQEAERLATEEAYDNLWLVEVRNDDHLREALAMLLSDHVSEGR